MLYSNGHLSHSLILCCCAFLYFYCIFCLLLFSLFSFTSRVHDCLPPLISSSSFFISHTHKPLGHNFVCTAHEFSLEYLSKKINSWKQQVCICRDCACERASVCGSAGALILVWYVWSCIIDWIQPSIYQPGFGLEFIAVFPPFEP